MTRRRIFISSVQKELAEERSALRAFLQGDALFRKFFDVVLFEDLPAKDQRADDLYLAEVDRCDVYIGIFGQEYGFENADGRSPTELEFDRAGEQGKPRLVFVKGQDDTGRHPRMLALIRKAGTQLIRRRFRDVPELTASVYASLIDYLETVGAIQTGPFDASVCPGASRKDLSSRKVSQFLALARAERNYPLPARTPMLDVLQHLRLIVNDQPTHAAILLFGKHPQRFLITSSVKCLHFHGTEIAKPIPSYQTYSGTVFEMADQALDFVMSKVNAAVGTRAESARAPVTYELPRGAVSEAIVNAIAHRDYASNASVQVMLFSDRLEIWNPGELPQPLTFDSLRTAHPSIPRNPLIAEPMYLARYIEKAGTGTLDMAKLCTDAGLRPPDFREAMGQFIQTIWRPADGTAQATAQAEAIPKLLSPRALEELALALGLPTAQVTAHVAAQAAAILSIVSKAEYSRDEIQTQAGFRHREHFRKAYLEPLLSSGWIERTIPEKPRSPAQKYRVGPLGRRWLSQLKE